MKVRNRASIRTWKGIAAATAGAAAIGITAWLMFLKKDNLPDTNVSEEADVTIDPTKPKTKWRKLLPKMVITKTAAPIANPANVARQLLEQAIKRSIDGVLGVLNQLQNVGDYQLVNEAYKLLTDQRTMIRQTIVTSLLDRYFSGNTNAKERIKEVFIRIGLKINPQGKWSLSGFEKRKDLITNVSTFVTDWMGNRIAVKAETILGEAQMTTNGMTRFQGLDGKTYKVPDRDVRYL
jgi:hypothetical protein